MSYQYYQHATDIVGYTYNASMYCPDCIVLAFYRGFVPPQGKGSAERMLTKLAGVVGIDRMDETTYDSSEFPKVIFRSNLEYPELPGSRWVETCESCGEELK